MALLPRCGVSASHLTWLRAPPGLGIEKVLSWIKQSGGLRHFKLRDIETLCFVIGLHVTDSNLIQLGNLFRTMLAFVHTNS
jgi:hypothetical protein